MDPLSIASLLLQIGSIVASLIDYGKSVEGASDEIRKLSEELFALKGVLEHIQTQINAESSTYLASLTANYRTMLVGIVESTHKFLQSLLNDLELPKRRFKKSMKKLEWPFKKQEVNQHLARLERVKSWLILVVTADTSSTSREIYSEISKLAISLQESLRITEQERSDKADREFLRWLAPVGPTEDHLRAGQNLQSGTGGWFINGPMTDWLESTATGSTMLCLRGKCKQ